MINMSELESALRAKGYKTKREAGYSIVLTLEGGDEMVIGGDYYPNDLAGEDNLSWWIVGQEDEEELTSGGYYDEEDGLPFTVETIVNLIDEFQY